jgi:hypothetical protein
VQQWNKGPMRKTAETNTDGEDMLQELQEARVTGDGESSSWAYDSTTRRERLDIWEGPATAQAQEEAADGVGTRSIGALVTGRVAPQQGAARFDRP